MHAGEEVNLRLTDAVERLRLAQSGELQTPRPGGTVRGEIRRASHTHGEPRAEEADAQRDLFEVLPENCGEIKPADHASRERDPPCARRADQEPPVRQRKDAALHRPCLERLRRNQHGF